MKSTKHAITTQVAINTFFSRFNLVKIAVLNAHWCQDNQPKSQLKNQTIYIAVFQKLNLLNFGLISIILKNINRIQIINLNIVVSKSYQSKLKSIFNSRFDNCISKYAQIIAHKIQVNHNLKTIFLSKYFQTKNNLNKLFNKWTIQVIAIAIFNGKNIAKTGSRIVQIQNQEKKVKIDAKNATIIGMINIR